MKRNVKLIIEYDGSNYSGWQKQKHSITVQQKIEEAISEITKTDTEIIGCSRTDAGVHARNFVANFITESSVPPSKFKYAINSKLPKDIVIKKSSEVPLDFHARFHSKGKKYVYTILNREEPPTIDRNVVYHFNKDLDVNAMKMASKYFIGSHEFDSFYKKSGSSVKSTLRTIYYCDVTKCEDVIKFTVIGEGFLYNMVRIMAGTLIEAGIGRIIPEDIKAIILAKDREKAGRSLPPQGLCLQEVLY
ncbi:tRNA pseudouridine(38-40) synthase TruA [Clostridium botulinum C]|uniref:tRNA pseudouridine synthase A n=2 Tax=Clostridium botulinum TaxID=1491 RepID=A0A9Q4TF15_CLOBO|nr:tRNA pseudouridine(38-40) synthase TruA [Clostridium botulinum]EGO87876.1 pseudouridine synthase [Clostridium botulinum C str. Stockholm]MCD3195152.1 tRNA pseudouridine(38-40) synthase TruA [Clostridium botulinum C]MCD3200492.1 tRNA pseudouridine(38-40) synthase TruA [Clostridium botulinum C]MCD3205910.1 tRNA pseudouridine(38-40) synthase TruA [Clostridium botulinum C]MCD3209256.1 tRNA pseudouridine(38-40) synthase TruA [Clostridium botulinum C]